jgi:starch phosphorylase
MSITPDSASPQTAAPSILVEDDRTSYTEEGFLRGLVDHLHFTLGKDDAHATQHDRYLALAHAVRDRVMAKWMRTKDTYRKQDPKRVYYLSAEFLLGRALQNNLINLGLYDTAKRTTERLGAHLADLLDQERDAGLGNGGLGRLAACYLDSMAQLALPAYGYGIRYEFGIFDQVIRNGCQIERPEEWLRYGSPWLIPRPEFTQSVHFYGHTEIHGNGQQPQVRWVDTTSVLGVPHDMPIAGYRNDTVNTLRLWSARSSEEFDLTVFNAGDYERAVFDKNNSESISKVLYPNDLLIVGKELRLKQQYFFVACAIADLLRRHLDHARHKHDPQAVRDRLLQLPEKVAIQLNDTHPSIAIVELMRLLIDKYELPWETAWPLCQSVFSYTNHTLLPEALEVWSVDLLGKLLPRHLQIIYEINHRFLRQVWTNNPSDAERLQRMSVVQEQPFKGVRMAYLATLGSHKVNGVAELHSRLLRETLLPDYFAMFPERFINVTNGVTPRRWLLSANPELSAAITRRIGDSWVTDLERVEDLLAFSKDPEFQAEVAAVKLRNKQRLCDYIVRHHHIQVDPHMLFDVQVKRLHEYKRQLLNVLHIIALYQRLKNNPSLDVVPRLFLFGAKAAPGYFRAKLIIRLINAVADVVNHDPHVNHKLKVLFLSNYRVSLAEKIIPAADLSEQISTAGFEASGTGNMKLSMNGALTIGTLDGANVEIRNFVGPENFFLFGLTADEVLATRSTYNPWEFYRRSPALRAAIDLIRSGFFSYDEPGRYQPLLDALLPPEEKLGRGDPFLVLADFDAYAACQQAVDATYRDPNKWVEMAIHNIARTGFFSSDRSVREYAQKIWNARPVRVI